MPRHGVSDEQWATIEDLFPKPKPTGRPPMPARQAFDATCWILRSGAPWRDLPEELGPWQTAYAHFNRWSSDGTLAKVFRRLQERFSAEDRFDHTVWSIDGTIARAHRCAGGGGKKGIRGNRRTMPSAARAADFPRKSTRSATARAPR